MRILPGLLIVFLLGLGLNTREAGSLNSRCEESEDGTCHKSCNVCNYLGESLSYLKEIHAKLLAPNRATEGTPTTGLLVRTGIPSDTADDSLSVGTCPAGSTVVGCRCSHEDITFDGVAVSGQECKAWKSYVNREPIQAIALCAIGEADLYSLRRAPVFSAFSQNPRPVCPVDTQVVACFLVNLLCARGSEKNPLRWIRPGDLMYECQVWTKACYCLDTKYDNMLSV